MQLTSCRYGCDTFRVLRYLGLLLLTWRDVRTCTDLNLKNLNGERSRT
jgi:hypothetical protein